MKKFLLSTIVILGFAGYASYARMKNPDTTSVGQSAPVGISSTTPTATPSLSMSPTPSPTISSHKPAATMVQDTPTNTPTPTTKPNSLYKDGTYTGDATDAFYGNIQVQAVISGGRITNIQFLQYPNDRDRSIMINQQADPMLAQEAIQAQSAQVDVVSGATDSSQAFVESLQSALDKAKS